MKIVFNLDEKLLHNICSLVATSTAASVSRKCVCVKCVQLLLNLRFRLTEFYRNTCSFVYCLEQYCMTCPFTEKKIARNLVSRNTWWFQIRCQSVQITKYYLSHYSLPFLYDFSACITFPFRQARQASRSAQPAIRSATKVDPAVSDIRSVLARGQGAGAAHAAHTTLVPFARERHAHGPDQR